MDAGPGYCALLRLPESLRRADAPARPRRQPGRACSSAGKGVGLCSYLLIGFWFTDEAKAQRGQQGVHRQPHRRLRLPPRHLHPLPAYSATRLSNRSSSPTSPAPSDARVAGIVTRRSSSSSAPPARARRFPLYVWLPDAMAGPTPVSALIHAATMVTAGVYMVARCISIFIQAPGVAARWSPIVGALTALFAATIATRAERHQEGARLLHGVAAGLHVRRRGRGRVLRGHLPSGHSRLLQGLPVPRLRRGDPRPARRTGHAQDGRPQEVHAADALDLPHRHRGHHRNDSTLRLLLEGRDPRPGAPYRRVQRHPVVAGGSAPHLLGSLDLVLGQRHRAPDRDLYVAPVTT